MTTKLCPLCRQPLREYFRMASNEVVVYCSDVHHNSLTQSKHTYLEGTGNSTEEAHKRFLENANKTTIIRP